MNRKALKTPKKVRFWEQINGDWVKLTIVPDQTIRHYRFTVTDEGWRSTEREYEYNSEDGIVSAHIVRDGRDCDGRLTYTWEGYFDPKGSTEPVFIGWDSKGNEMFSSYMKKPEWIKTRAHQRDFTAEAAGY